MKLNNLENEKDDISNNPQLKPSKNSEALITEKLKIETVEIYSSDNQKYKDIITCNHLKNPLITQLENAKKNASVEFNNLPCMNVKDLPNKSLAKLKCKNQYKNIIPFCDNLVNLNIEMGDNAEDSYINASFIQGPCGSENKYIAAQGPLPETILDTWRLVWQYKISTIVMLTRCLENGRYKCEEYWPTTFNKKINVKTISIKLLKMHQFADFVYSKLSLKDSRYKNEIRIIHHFYFTEWQDMKLPINTFSLLSFIKMVHNTHEISGGPLLVHCKAGVGRTGTFIAIDYLLDLIQRGSNISIFQCVKNLRFQRMRMILNLKQYEFVYDSIIESLKFDIKGIPINKYKAYYTNEVQNGNAILCLLESLNAVRNFERISDGREGENNLKNRDKSIFAYEHSRALKVTDFKSYINAVAINSFYRKRGYILTQHPMNNTIEDFWIFVYKLKIKCIIMLDHVAHMKHLDLPCYWFESEKSFIIGPFTIKLLSIETLNSFTIRCISVFCSTLTELEPQIIKHYTFTNDVWPIGASYPTEESVLSNLKEILNIDNKEQILIHCANGCSRSSILCAAWYMLDVFKYQAIVNVPLACRYVIDARPQAFKNSVCIIHL